ncbi:unnamed protein product [Mytilus coruscus]|uniref:G-protein coupled receptors family 2 profile 2 domain-containing protein n=1 Tax=Mytilus coruscus TaxID=42192 RepID=A0A6J8D957_MYTCO|nr:unnamed protein product [Mytilus coruscus]
MTVAITLISPDNSTISSDLHFDCMPPIMFKSQFNVQGYLVVKTCPKDLKNTEIDIKCQSDDIFSFGPRVITDSNIVFKNRFCAKCNNANVYKPFDVIFTHINDTVGKNNNPSIVMASLQDSYKKRGTNELVVEFIPPVAENLRECILYSDPKNESENCLNYYISPAIVQKTGKNEIVRNTFCIDPDFFLGCIGMFDSVDGLASFNDDPFPMSVLFQFQQGCKGEFDVDGICLQRFYEKEINIYASLVSSTNLSESMIEEILTLMAWSFSDEILAITFRYSYSVEKIDNRFHIADVNIYGEMIEKKSYEEGLNIDSQLDEAQWLIRSSYRTELSKPTVKNKLNQFQANFDDNFEKKLCAKSIIECEITSDTENPRTVIKEFTCVDFIQQQPTFASTDINMNVITYTGMGISVIALTASIIVYRRLGLHSSIPGSNVENLTIALLITDIIFMLGIGANDLSLVCYSIGVALHYLWLLVFSFKCIALIQMCHNLTEMSLIAGDIGEGMFSKKPLFTLLGLLLPFLFVVPAVLIDLLEVQGVSIDYSGSVCFPTGYPGNLIFVSAPIGLAVVINITCFLCIAVVIAKQSLGIRHIRRSNSFQFLPVFVRMSLVTGMLWISGLLGAIIQNEVMEYFFVICFSFQGLLIAFGKLTTKRIYRELRKRKQSLSK